MKQFVKSALATAAFVFTSVACAAPITTTIDTTFTHQGGSNTIDVNSFYDVNFNLTLTPYLYRPSIDTVTSAELLFRFKDTGPDNKNNPNNENFTIKIGSDLLGSSGGIINIVNNGADFPFSITNTTSLTNFSDTGLLSLRISTTSGSFQFVSANLKANVNVGEGSSSEVPEPLAVALLGIGVAGIAASRRRKI
ncbi:PEP-CTERM sorting domain-containing protein [Massilia sp. LC238]|uniref:PEP-CTERM sorting domain-containing protein n=1 Tax=Massilia sp. LC238 TaxID=1502852 RepID=UPI0004E2930A|nr:PEP-CTERM sorting domain-containing protein [Massilia sp. LC238]KFC61912.1 PEP-CTERM motif-containing protein [Massilia sp. LC238]